MPKIAFWRTIGETFLFVFSNLPGFFRLGRISIVCLFFSSFLIALISGKYVILPPNMFWSHHYFFSPVGVWLPPGNLFRIILFALADVTFLLRWLPAVQSVFMGGATQTEEPVAPQFFFYLLVPPLVMTCVLYLIFLFLFFEFSILSIGAEASDVARRIVGETGMITAILLAAVIVVFWRLSRRLPDSMLEGPLGEYGREWQNRRTEGPRLLLGTALCVGPFFCIEALELDLLRWNHGLFGWTFKASIIELCMDIFLVSMAVIANFLHIATVTTFLCLFFRRRAEVIDANVLPDPETVSA